jgi:hypothetical protein
MNRSIMAFFKKNEDYLNISKIARANTTIMTNLDI